MPCDCCAAFRYGSLAKYSWFKFKGTLVLDHINAAIATGLLKGLSDTPPGWLKPARKQLPLTELERRCTTTWNVPAADLQKLLAPLPILVLQGEWCSSMSDTVYMAGTGVRILPQPAQVVGGKTSYGVYLQLADHVQHGFTLCSAKLGMSCHFAISRQVPGQVQMSEIVQDKVAVTRRGWGKSGLIKASTPADLEPYLVDGQLKLKATIRLIPG
jgi:hypothetical protein